MLKISEIKSAPPSVVLHLEGRIVGPWVDELRQVCAQHLLEGHRLQLQLADVEFMDAEGVALLASLRSRGVTFVDAPPFVAEQLKIAAMAG
jgi:anti-anti-sigma regulatory factor